MSNGITLAARVRASDDVVFRNLGEELVLLNLKTGVYFGLDPAGTRIWHLRKGPCSLQKVLAALVEEYDVAEGRCERDLLHFVGLLREKELIEVSD